MTKLLDTQKSQKPKEQINGADGFANIGWLSENLRDSKLGRN
jgi:hypothetical protein